MNLFRGQKVATCCFKQHVAGKKQLVAGNKQHVARHMLLVRATCCRATCCAGINAALDRDNACAINKLMVTELPRKLKIGMMEAHHTSNP